MQAAFYKKQGPAREVLQVGEQPTLEPGPGEVRAGFTAFEFATSAKWLELIKEIAPELRRIAFVFNPEATPFAEKFVNSIEGVAPSLGVELV